MDVTKAQRGMINGIIHRIVSFMGKLCYINVSLFTFTSINTNIAQRATLLHSYLKRTSSGLLKQYVTRFEKSFLPRTQHQGTLLTIKK